MLAIVGFLTTQFVHLPGDAYQESNPLKAIDAVGLGVNLQILLGKVYVYKLFDKNG
jgi:hypothetical protein